MSQTGLYSSDIRHLRHLGSLVDSVLVGARRADDATFRRDCDELGRVLQGAAAARVESLENLIFHELLAGFRESSAADRLKLLEAELARYALGTHAIELLEELGRSLEQERAATANRMQSPR